MDLMEMYRNYLKQEADFEKNDAVFNSRVTDFTNSIKERLKGIDVDLLNELDIDFNLDANRLQDKEYVKELMNEVNLITQKLEAYGNKLMEGAGYVED